MADHTCKGHRKDGEPCQAPLSEPGYCHHHKHQAPDSDDAKELTAKERRLLEEYFVDFNGAAAARRAGYSPKCARQIAYETLSKPHMASRVKARLDKLAMSAEEGSARLARMGRGTMAHFIDVDGEHPSLDLTSDEARAHMDLVKKFKKTIKRFGDEGEIVELEFELHDAKDAIKTLLKGHGKLAELVEHTVDDDAAERLARALGVKFEDA